MGLFSGISRALFGAPPTFDARGTIDDQARQNRVNTINPFGSTTFSQSPDGRWTANTAFSSSVQPAFDRFVNVAGNTPQYTAPEYQNLFSKLENATFDRGYNLLRPEIDRRNRAFEQTMANRGLPVGSEAYADAFNLERGAQDRALEDLALSAVLAGRQEQGRLFGQDLASQNAEYAQLAGLVSQLQPTQAPPVDVTGPALGQYQSNLNRYNHGTNLFNQLLNAGSSFGSAYLLGR